jgi:hypothetical protein
MKVISLALGAIALASQAHAQAVTESGAYLRYTNTTPSILFGAGGAGIDFGATEVIPNGSAGTTGEAFTTNLSTGALLGFPIYWSIAQSTTIIFSGVSLFVQWVAHRLATTIQKT